MKHSAFLIRAVALLVFAGSFLASTQFSLSSDATRDLQRRVFDPVPKVSQLPRPGGTVIAPTLPPGGIVLPSIEGERHRPEEPAVRPPANVPQYGYEYGGHGTDVFQARYREKSRSYGSRDSHERRHRHPPSGALSFYISGVPFFYHSGIYYRQHRDEYVIVRAPIGARVQVLPDGCSTLQSRGRSYYLCDDDYYEPYDGGYIVIERPVYVDREPDIEVGDEVRVRVDVLNVRSGPGRRYDIIYQLYRGDIVLVRDKRRGWYFVDLPDGSSGWVVGEHIRRYRGR